MAEHIRFDTESRGTQKWPIEIVVHYNIMSVYFKLNLHVEG